MKKFFKTRKQKFQIVIAALSLLSLIPFGILLYHLYQLQLIATTEMNNEALINIVLSRTISSPLILSGFIIGIIVWLSNSVISSIGIHKKIIPPSFGYISLVLGGLGIHFLWLLFSLIKVRTSKTRATRTIKGKNVIIVSTISAIMGAIICFFAIGISINSYDAPYLGAPVEFSTQASSPNVIEIFTDGFDQSNRAKYENDEDFKDFNWFNKFQTVGTATHRSVPSIWGDFKTDNPFAVLKSHKEKNPNKLSTIVYGDTFLKTGTKHLANYKANFSQRTVINTICMSNDPGYSPATSGTPKAIAKIDPDLNIVNWSGARDYNAGKFGVSNLSPDGNSYKYFTDSSVVKNELEENLNGRIVKSSNKGAYVLINDLITHKPYMSSASSDFTIFNTDAEDQYIALKHELKTLFRKLKSNNVSGRSVYDNSMIIVYGDHSNHYKDRMDSTGNVVNYRHAESAMMIKYPNYSLNSVQQTSMRIINDRVVFSGSINKIINNFVMNKSNDSKTQLDYILKNSKFDEGISRPTFFENNHFMMTKWGVDPHGDSILVPDTKFDITNSGKPKYIYSYDEWKNLPTSSDPLESVVY